MRVIHIITTMDRGGAENHVAALALAQVRVGLDARIAYIKGAGEASPPGVISRRISRSGPARGLVQLKTLVRDADIVHAHLPRAELASAAVVNRSQPLVISRHNTEPFLSASFPRASQAISRAAASRAGAVIAISEAVRNYHLSTGQLSSKSRIAVIPYGYEPHDGVLPDEQLWDPQPSESSKLRIACVARLTMQKDLPTLLRATAILRAAGLVVDLRIAGDGPERADLLRLIDSLQLQGHASLIGRISNPEAFIAGADIFALPSKYEGLGLVLLEAMGVGTPIVAARNTAIAEVVVDGESGLLFRTGDPTDLASQMRRLAFDPSLRATLSAAGAQRLRSHYSVDRMLQQTMSVYERALERAT